MSKSRRKAVSILMTLVLTVTALGITTGESYAASTKIRLKGANLPTAILVGKQFKVKGKIVSNKSMKRVEIGIVNAANNNWVYKYSKKKLNTKKFNIKNARKKLKFKKLPPGEYRYRIYVQIKKKTWLVLNQPFTVVSPAPVSAPGVTSTPGTSSGTQSAGTTNPDPVELSGVNYPTQYNIGTAFNTRGTVSCSNTIRRIEAGIVVTATNKWSEYKYDAAVNANSFDLRNVDSVLKFSKLPGGDYTYRIYVHTDNGVTVALNRKFKVNPSTKPYGAINWAVAIANNNGFTYGKGYGGFFTCCICAGKYSKPEDAKFTCMPFLAAAYAHGTGDSSLMNNGRHVMNLNDDNFKGTLGNAWFKVGLCRDLDIKDLQPGDVIIKWCPKNENGHAWMYGGGDSIVEAVPADIRVLTKGAAKKLKSYGTSEGTPSKNYVMRYRH